MGKPISHDGTVRTCPKCKKFIPRDRTKCYFCGYASIFWKPEVRFILYAVGVIVVVGALMPYIGLLTVQSDTQDVYHIKSKRE